MRILNMFAEDINRKINGVVKVDQDASDVLVQELNEYVITRELKKHFITFFRVFPYWERPFLYSFFEAGFHLDSSYPS